MRASGHTSDPEGGDMDTKVFLERLNAGTDSGLEELYLRYFEKLKSLAARRMGTHVRAEPESVVMSALGSLVGGFRRPPEQRRFHVADSRRLWNLLVTITLNKIRQRAAQVKHLGPEPSNLDTQLAKGPGPDDLTGIEDLIEAALAGQDADYRQILKMLLDGCSRTEISRELKLPYATVKYKARRLSDRLARLLEQSERD